MERDAAARERLASLAAERSMAALGLPAFLVRGKLLIGFSGKETSGRQLLALIEGEAVSSRGGAVCPATEAAPDCAPPAPSPPRDTIDAPWVGQVSVRELGLPTFTVLIGLIDGFNPCAMWVLLFLLSLLVNLRDRRKMFVVGGTFVLTPGGTDTAGAAPGVAPRRAGAVTDGEATLHGTSPPMTLARWVGRVSAAPR